MLHFEKDALAKRDISRPLTKLLGVAVLILFSVFAYAGGPLRGAEATVLFVGVICGLLAIYLTYTWQWPRLFRYIGERWRERY